MNRKERKAAKRLHMQSVAMAQAYSVTLRDKELSRVNARIMVGGRMLSTWNTTPIARNKGRAGSRLLRVAHKPSVCMSACNAIEFELLSLYNMLYGA